jgi:hypothetical protein
MSTQGEIMTKHNEIRKSIVEKIGLVQSYSVNSVISSISNPKVLAEAGILLGRLYLLLSDEDLNNYFLDSHPEYLESTYLSLISDCDLFISKISFSAKCVVESSLEKWNSDAKKMSDLILFPEQKDIPEESLSKEIF